MMRIVPRPDVARRLVFGVLLCATTSTAGCTRDSTGDGAVLTDSAGVTVVSNRGPDAHLEWRIHRLFALGGRETGPETFYEVRQTSVGVDASGDLYVLDARAHRVIVFDGDGNHLRTMGREGEGPGELALPFSLTVRPDGTALVDDLGRGRLIAFAPDGTSADTEQRPLPGTRRVYWNGGSYESDMTLDTVGVQYELNMIAGADTTTVADFHVSVGMRLVELPSCGMSFSGMPPLFAKDQRWDAWGSRLAVRSGAAYEVDVYESGRHVTRARRRVDPLPASTELAVRELGEAMTIGTSAGERRCDPVETVEQRGYEGVLPAIRELRVDPGGRIWIGRAGPRPESTPTDILAADGTYLGTLPSTVPFPIGFLPDGRALVAETDDLGVTRLAVYRVEEVPSGFEPE